MKEPTRGDIYFAELGYGEGHETYGQRPVFVIWNTAEETRSSIIIVAPMTSKIKGYSTHHVIRDKHCGILRDSTIMLDQVRAIDKSRLFDFVGHLDDEEIKEVMDKLGCVLGLSVELEEPEPEETGEQRMNELQIFNYSDKQVRTILKDGEPWFVAKDVCDVLGITNGRDAVLRLDLNDDERAAVGLTDTSSNGVTQSRVYTIVSESGLYALVMASRKEEAEQFKRWVRKEVLPSIRKHGAYMTPDTIDKIIADPDFGIKLLTALKSEREKNSLLVSENKLLANENVTWTNRKVLEAIVKKYGGKVGYESAWREFKRELLYKYSINLNSRITSCQSKTGKKTPPKTLDMVHDNELDKCIGIAASLCENNDVDISDIISKYQKVQEEKLCLKQ
jgi:prophage antirepressor-like protein/mRNA-degrading endonuclease toxin of MazEF toxin-antitoxin module